MLDLRGAQEWVVTTKLGSSDVRPGTTPVVTRNCRLYAGEMGMSAFVLAAAFYGVFTVNRWTFSIFLFLQVLPDQRRFTAELAFGMPVPKLRSCTVNTKADLFAQGMVFFAFGLNMVDCGGLLGGRLDSGDSKLPAKKVRIILCFLSLRMEFCILSMCHVFVRAAAMP